MALHSPMVVTLTGQSFLASEPMLTKEPLAELFKANSDLNM
jgi:hypothetical protein